MVNYGPCEMSREERAGKDFFAACNEHILGARLVSHSAAMRRQYGFQLSTSFRQP